MTGQSEALCQLVEAVRHSRKYATVSPLLIAQIGARELAIRRGLKEAIKTTKRKLHQVAGAYLPDADYARWLEELRAAAQREDREALRAACRGLMAHHASTSERLPILEAFYRTTLAAIAPVHSVVDIACGLNPLAISWMPLAPGARYVAYDIYEDLTTFLTGALPLLGVEAHAETRDVLHDLPLVEADLALVLKALPCLDQIEEDAGEKLLDGLRARHLLVSFPTESLCGRHKGMVINYEARFWSWADRRGWRVERFLFEGELAFLVYRE